MKESGVKGPGEAEGAGSWVAPGPGKELFSQMQREATLEFKARHDPI